MNVFIKIAEHPYRGFETETDRALELPIGLPLWWNHWRIIFHLQLETVWLIHLTDPKMRLTLLAGASANAVTVNADDFVVVPDGYHGFFDGWNTTQLIVENEHDEIFHAFENEVSELPKPTVNNSVQV